jgi:iron complex outermembrane receptor protein
MNFAMTSKMVRAAHPLICIVACCSGAAAIAQTMAAEHDDSALQEVVVTATRRSETVINTPASVSAVTAADLGAGRIQNVADLAEAVPNLSVGNQFGVNRAFIRGIGLTSIDLGGDGAVAFLQNGAQIARPAQQLSGFYDLDRVEVLRGPQGTLYGRSATAGVINLVTKAPTDHLEGYANLTFGNYATKIFEGAIGGPIVDMVSGRIAAKIEKHDGYGTNLYTGTQIDDRDAQSIRGSLRFKPTDHLLIDLIADYMHENDDDYAFHYFGPTVTTNAGLPAVALFGGKTIFNCCGTTNPNLRNLWSSVDPINKRHGIGATTIVDWSPDNFDLKSITAYRNFTRFNQDDLAVSDAVLYGKNLYDESSESYSQDFTVSTKAAGILWLGGVSFFHERLFGSVKVPTIGLGVTLTGGNCRPRVASASLPCNFEDAGNYWQLGTVTTNAYGVFVQGTYSFTDKLELTAGLRFSHEARSGNGSFIFDALGVDVPTDQSASWNAVTPKLLLEYHPDADTLIYASVNRGFKSGVINVGSQNPVINPEYVYAYETGFKERALDDRVQFTAAAFFYDYKNLQVGFVNAQSVVETVNAAAAHNYGIETELIAKVTPRLQLNLAATYLSAKYTSFTTGNYRAGFAATDVSGNYLDNAPPYTARVGLEYTQPLPDGAGSLHMRAEDSYQGRVYFTEFNNGDATQAGYGLINGSAGWESSDAHWSVTAWVRNAADKFAIANDIISAPLYSSVRVGTVIAPRTYGATLGYKF